MADSAAFVGGNRVYLRAPTPADRNELARLGADSGRLHRPWLTAPSTPAAVDVWLTRMGSDRSAAFLVCRREDDAIVGVFNLTEIVRGSFQSCYSSYYAHASFAGNGYMREGLELLLRHVFRSMGLHRMTASIQPGNAASIALVLGAGFRLEVRSQGYPITKEDWLGRRLPKART